MNIQENRLNTPFLHKLNLMLTVNIYSYPGYSLFTHYYVGYNRNYDRYPWWKENIGRDSPQIIQTFQTWELYQAA